MSLIKACLVLNCVFFFVDIATGSPLMALLNAAAIVSCLVAMDSGGV